MNYKQNQRIMQITESTLIVGVDIAKEKHVARAQDFRGIEFGKRLVYDNTREGFQQYLQWVRTLMAKHGKTEAIVGAEPTGHYWLPFGQFLQMERIKLVLVNPMHVKKSKELDDNSPTKNDIKDPRVIAQLVKDGRYSEARMPTQVHAELRVAMLNRERLVEDLTRVELRIHNWLDRYFPEYRSVFKKWEGKASLVTLKQFPLPADIVHMGAEAIVREWKKEVKGAVGLKRAEQLVHQAKKSIGLVEGTQMARMEIAMHLAQYEMLTSQMKILWEQVEKLTEQIPGTKEMESVPSLSLKTVAGFLAETGDLANYEHPQQIIRLAGFNLKGNSSGNHAGKTSITKRGRKRLRKLLFNAVMALVRNNPEFRALHHYFTTRRENPLKKKQSLIALCGKLIRILFTLGRKQLCYDADKVLGEARRNQIQLAA